MSKEQIQIQNHLINIINNLKNCILSQNNNKYSILLEYHNLILQNIKEPKIITFILHTISREIYNSDKIEEKKIILELLTEFFVPFKNNIKETFPFLSRILTTIQSNIKSEIDSKFLSEIYTKILNFIFIEKNIENKQNYEILQGFCIYNMKQNEECFQNCGLLCLKNLILNLDIYIKKEKYMKYMFEKIILFLENFNFYNKTILLSCLNDFILKCKESYKQYASLTLYKVLDFLQNDNENLRKEALNVIYLLIFYCPKEIENLKQNIMDFIKILKNCPDEFIMNKSNQIYNLLLYNNNIDNNSNSNESYYNINKNFNLNINNNDINLNKKQNNYFNYNKKHKKFFSLSKLNIKKNIDMDIINKSYYHINKSQNHLIKSNSSNITISNINNSNNLKTKNHLNKNINNKLTNNNSLDNNNNNNNSFNTINISKNLMNKDKKIKNSIFNSPKNLNFFEQAQKSKDIYIVDNMHINSYNFETFPTKNYKENNINMSNNNMIFNNSKNDIELNNNNQKDLNKEQNLLLDKESKNTYVISSSQSDEENESIKYKNNKKKIKNNILKENKNSDINNSLIQTPNKIIKTEYKNLSPNKDNNMSISINYAMFNQNLQSRPSSPHNKLNNENIINILLKQIKDLNDKQIYLINTVEKLKEDFYSTNKTINERLDYIEKKLEDKNLNVNNNNNFQTFKINNYEIENKIQNYINDNNFQMIYSIINDMNLNDFNELSNNLLENILNYIINIIKNNQNNIQVKKIILFIKKIISGCNNKKNKFSINLLNDLKKFLIMIKEENSLNEEIAIEIQLILSYLTNTNNSLNNSILSNK